MSYVAKKIDFATDLLIANSTVPILQCNTVLPGLYLITVIDLPGRIPIASRRWMLWLAITAICPIGKSFNVIVLAEADGVEPSRRY